MRTCVDRQHIPEVEMSNDFTHLHVHCLTSILDGIIKFDELAKRVKSLGMSSVALSDHGMLHGWIDFYKACKKEDIRPLLAVEAYLTEDENGIEDNKYKTRDNWHCILIARNNRGLMEIIRLSNNATLRNFYYKPRISIDSLLRSQYRGDIIVSSACLGGIITKQGEFDEGNKTFNDIDKKAIKMMGKFKDLFGPNFYTEIQDNPEFWEQAAYNDWLVKHSKQEGVPLIITSDAHFLTKEDKDLHNIVMAQQMKKTVEEYSCDEDGMKYGEGHYIRSPDEMLQAALKYNAEEAFYNTTEISKRCNVEITLGEYEAPHFDITKEDDYSDFLSWKEKQ